MVNLGGNILEELYRETSTTANDRKVFAGLALLCIFALFGYEISAYFETGHVSYLGFGIDLCLLSLALVQKLVLALKNFTLVDRWRCPNLLVLST